MRVHVSADFKATWEEQMAAQMGAEGRREGRRHLQGAWQHRQYRFSARDNAESGTDETYWLYRDEDR